MSVLPQLRHLHGNSREDKWRSADGWDWWETFDAMKWAMSITAARGEEKL